MAAATGLTADADGSETTAESTDELIKKLRREKAELESRLDFVEGLVGPTEAQRKELHEQVLAAREAALRASHLGMVVPTKVFGRLDERLVQRKGLSERDVGLLQGGCLPDEDGILQDVSLLGDPAFRPYNEQTGELRWQERGGVLGLSLEEVRDRFGQTVTSDVIRCSKELDRYDASRRVGVELPWHPKEDRELRPAEVISLVVDSELGLRSPWPADEDDDRLEVVRGSMAPIGAASTGAAGCHPEHHRSPYAVAYAPPRRGRGRQQPRGRSHPNSASLAAVGGPLRSARDSRGHGHGSSSPTAAAAVVPLPRIPTGRAGVAMAFLGGGSPPLSEARCHAAPGLWRHSRAAQDPLVHPLLACQDRSLRLI
mmetsp:Transcript_14541/g.37604  ORF Transcript_14541/g.37604 Transcript_14541/m.37604 type:complete len:371 (-) Transcript_14541:248-1360(-)